MTISDERMMEIMQSYGVVEIYRDNDTDRCMVRSYWEPGMPRFVNYFSINSQCDTDPRTPLQLSYNKLYYDMMREVGDG